MRAAAAAHRIQGRRQGNASLKREEERRVWNQCGENLLWWNVVQSGALFIIMVTPFDGRREKTTHSVLFLNLKRLADTNQHKDRVLETSVQHSSNGRKASDRKDWRRGRTAGKGRSAAKKRKDWPSVFQKRRTATTTTCQSIFSIESTHHFPCIQSLSSSPLTHTPGQPPTQRGRRPLPHPLQIPPRCSGRSDECALERNPLRKRR